MKKKIRVCPRCGERYDQYPALSRRDNKTNICPDCGTEEAIYDFNNGICPKGTEEREAEFAKKLKGGDV